MRACGAFNLEKPTVELVNVGKPTVFGTVDLMADGMFYIAVHSLAEATELAAAFTKVGAALQADLDAQAEGLFELSEVLPGALDRIEAVSSPAERPGHWNGEIWVAEDGVPLLGVSADAEAEPAGPEATP